MTLQTMMLEERSQILLSPTRKKSTNIENTDYTMHKEPTAFDASSFEEDTFNPNEVLHNILKDDATFNKYQEVHNCYVAMKKVMVDENTEVTVTSTKHSKTIWNVVDDVKEKRLT